MTRSFTPSNHSLTHSKSKYQGSQWKVLILCICQNLHSLYLDRSSLELFLLGSSEDVASNFLSTARVPFSVGLVTQFCESYFVFRTFQSNPNAWILEVVQRILSFVVVSSFSLSVLWLVQYLKWKD